MCLLLQGVLSGGPVCLLLQCVLLGVLCVCCCRVFCQAILSVCCCSVFCQAILCVCCCSAFSRLVLALSALCHELIESPATSKKDVVEVQAAVTDVYKQFESVRHKQGVAALVAVAQATVDRKRSLLQRMQAAVHLPSDFAPAVSASVDEDTAV